MKKTDWRFTAHDYGQLKKATKEAEEHLSVFYCIPGREWDKYKFNIRTEAETEGGTEASPGALAQLFKTSFPPARSSEKKEMFSICLFERNILRAASGAGGRAMLPPLFLYIMTHEIIHIIRFFSEPDHFWLSEEENREEEKKVHDLTKRVLLPHPDSRIKSVIEWLESSRVPIDAVPFH